MILIVEIILLIYGIIAIITGKFKLDKKKVVVGAYARLLGILCLMPIPFSLLVGFIYAICLAFTGIEADQIQAKYISNSFYLGVFSFIFIFLLIYFLYKYFYKIQNNKFSEDL